MISMMVRPALVVATLATPATAFAAQPVTAFTSLNGSISIPGHAGDTWAPSTMPGFGGDISCAAGTTTCTVKQASGAFAVLGGLSTYQVVPAASTTSSTQQNAMSCLNDAIAVGSSGFSNCFGITQTFGGSTATGGRDAAAFTTILQATTSSTNPNRNYVAMSAEAKANATDGGTLGGEQGALFGANLVAHAYYGATNYLDLAGVEINFGLLPGATAAYKFGVNIVNNSDGSHATRREAALGIGGCNGQSFTAQSDNAGDTATFTCQGLNTGILFTTANYGFPVATTGTLIGADAGTVANGLDFSQLNITGYLIKGANGAGITGAGAGLFSSLSLAGTALSGDGTNLIATGYLETLTTPATSSAPCTTGQFTDDANYHYVCVATNTWKRVALTAF